jgi:hypothetical protein
MKVLLIANIFFSVCSVIGSIIWAVQDDIYTLTSIYGFYWFVSVFSFISSLLGYLFHTSSFMRNEDGFFTNTIQKKGYGIYFMFFYSFTMTLFWLCASASVTRVTRDCLYIKNKYSSIVDYYYSSSEFTCNGEIITMTFGFVLFIVWSIVLLFVGKKLYLKIMEEVSQAQDVNIENIENTEQVEHDDIEMEKRSEKVETEQPAIV